ncbi:tetratricopeptide repeat protein, partial [Bacillus sp. 196mf]|uniref:tetratricopeptide repeat protein n=1 Tax=Bacillus sp. 196mf TaxID=1761754 RepID=UPI000D963E8B
RKLKKYLNQNNNEDVICVQLINYLGGVEDLNNSYCMDQQRIFRNFKGINFTNTIHETLSLNGVVKKIKFTDIKILPIKVYHFGYMDSRVLYKKKSQRNLEILQREVLKEDHSPWVEYHLASELYNIKEYYLSFYYINVSIKKFLEQEELPPPLIYLLKYSILFNIGDLNTICLAIDHAISLYPDYVDLIFLKGKILFKNKDYTNALRSFEKCIKLKGGSSSIYLSLKGTGSFISWYYKGRCLEHMNNIQGAKLAYQTSLLAYPNYTPAKEALSNIRLYHV